MSIFRGIRQTIRGGAGAGRGDNAHASPATSMPAPPRPPRPPARPLKIDSGSLEPNPVPNTRAARKANSPRAKAKALKEVNKNPLTPAEAPFGSEAGFHESTPAMDYNAARQAQQRMTDWGQPTSHGYSAYAIQQSKTLSGGDIRPMRERDSDRIGAYVNTGESPHGEKGSKWVAEHGYDVTKKRYG